MGKVEKIKKGVFLAVIIFCFGVCIKVPSANAAVLFSDDFNDNSLDAAKWIELDPATYISEMGEEINLSGSGGAWNTTALFSQSNITRVADTTFIATVNHASPNVMYGFKDDTANYGYENMVYGIYFRNSGGSNVIGIWENGSGSKIASVPYSLNTDYKIAIVLKAKGAKYYMQGGDFGAFGGDEWTLLYDSDNLSTSSLKAGFTVSYAAGQTMTMDDVSVVDDGINDTYNAFALEDVMVAEPTSTSVTLMAKTAMESDVTVDYGTTASYGNTVSSSNKTLHKIEIPGLSSGRMYHYRISAVENGHVSRVITRADSTFKTQAPEGADFSFATIADMQRGDWSDVSSQIQLLDPDLLLSAGDNVNGENSTDKESYFSRWQEDVFDYGQNLFDHIPSYWAMGNHDFINYTFSQDTPGSYAAFAELLALPIPVENTENYYSFDYGDAHFAVIDATQNTVSTANRIWLDADLAATTKKWKIVLMHMPNINPTGVSNLLAANPTAADALHDIFINRGVQLVVNGHSHIYHRWVKDGIFYVTNPTAGSTLWPVFNDSTGDAGSLGSSMSFVGYTVGEVSSNQLSISAYDSNGELKDSFAIAPGAFDLSSPGNNFYTNNPSPTLKWDESVQLDAGAEPPLIISKYQLYIDGVLNKDDISASSFSTTPTSPLSDGAHTWYVVAVNNLGETQKSANVYTINVDRSYVASVPVDPNNSSEGSFVNTSISFSSKDVKSGETHKEKNKLKFNDVSNATQYMISRNSDFSGAAWKPITSGVTVKFKNNQKTKRKYYVKFKTANQEESGIFEKTIKYIPTESRIIKNSKSNVVFGEILAQSGKNFSKNSQVFLYFSKAGGGYYPKATIMTDKNGNFMVKYKCRKSKGKYSWYAIDAKTGKRSKVINYTVN